MTGGAFGNWTGEPNPKFPKALNQAGISRAAGQAEGAILMKKEYVDIVLDKVSPVGPPMQALVFCTDPFLDTLHAAVHIYIGGQMFDPQTAPCEPLFYLHHCFLDSVWEKWRVRHQRRKQRESDYALPCPYNPFDLPDMPLLPYSIKVKDAYSNVYTDEFYHYQAWPTCENNCWNSTYLVCKKNGRCMSKIKVGGDCTGKCNRMTLNFIIFSNFPSKNTIPGISVMCSILFQVWTACPIIRAIRANATEADATLPSEVFDKSAFVNVLSLGRRMREHAQRPLCYVTLFLMLCFDSYGSFRINLTALPEP